jgi:mannose-1-phosphate guanylyltransferase
MYRFTSYHSQTDKYTFNEGIAMFHILKYLEEMLIFLRRIVTRYSESCTKLHYYSAFEKFLCT